MALIVNNLITKGMSGRYGKVLVFKQYSGKTVATAYPTPTSKLPTPLQIARRQKFAKAVAMTKLWLQNPEQKRLLEKLASHWASLSAYHAGIKYFMLDQPPVFKQVLANKPAAATRRQAAQQHPIVTAQSSRIYRGPAPGLLPKTNLGSRNKPPAGPAPPKLGYY